MMDPVSRRLPVVGISLVISLALLTLVGCAEDDEGSWNPCGGYTDCGWGRTFALGMTDDVDLLFVVDTTADMAAAQKKLVKAFPALVDALKMPDRGDKLPNLRVGVVSTDLGAGNLYSDNSCVTDGDQGKLNNKAQTAGCTAPSDKWIEYQESNGLVTTNVPGIGDHVAKIKSAFSCIAPLGSDGCRFSQPLASARLAVEATKNVNPGFLRNDDPCKATKKDALMAVVFLGDEDDCSAANPQLFDPSQQGLNDPLGPLTSFRCFEFGVKCECPGKSKCDRFTQGARKNCVPGGQYLHNVDNVISFWRNLKKLPNMSAPTGKCFATANPDRVIMAAIAGPSDTVAVAQEENFPILKASCGTTDTKAKPAVRIEALVHAFAKELTTEEINEIKAKQKNIPYYVDSTGKWREENFTSICSDDYSPALSRLGARIKNSMGTYCLAPPLTAGYGVACHKGQGLCGVKECGKAVICQESCLHKAEFTVQRYSAQSRTVIKQCPVALFDPQKTQTDCGADCPCWRIVPDVSCRKLAGKSPYRLQIMPKDVVSQNEYLRVEGAVSSYAWGSKDLLKSGQCTEAQPTRGVLDPPGCAVASSRQPAPLILILAVLAGLLFRRRSFKAYACLPLLVLMVTGCGDELEVASTIRASDTCQSRPLFLDQQVDLLFVIDNSGSLELEQKGLVANFPKLIEALRIPTRGNRLPDLRIGVVSTDLGAGNLYVDNACVNGGDKGKLQSEAKIAGCTPPKDRWIELKKVNGVQTSNVPGSGDPVQRVKDAFRCIASLGTDGCGFEQTIQSARLALDPALKVNPGFLRTDDPCKANPEDALLAVLFLTDEDDCSAANPQLFDPSQQGLNDPLGPLSSFRCFEFGVKCECPGKTKCDRFTLGPRKNCVPGGAYVHKVDNLITFFKNLKKLPSSDAVTGKCTGSPNPSRVLMAAIAGPTNLVEVGLEGKKPTLKPSCSAAQGFAHPAVRIEALVHAFAKELSIQEIRDIKAKKTHTPYFVDYAGKWREENFSSICTNDFSPALARLGDRIVRSFGTSCLRKPVLTDAAGILCRKGDVICDAATCGKEVVCQKDCLTLAPFVIREHSASSSATIKKCSDALFDPSTPATSCGAECPCWRMVADAQCARMKGWSPYRLEIMRTTPIPAGTYASFCALQSSYPWGSKEVGNLEQCTVKPQGGDKPDAGYLPREGCSVGAGQGKGLPLAGVLILLLALGARRRS